MCIRDSPYLLSSLPPYLPHFPPPSPVALLPALQYQRRLPVPGRAGLVLTAVGADVRGLVPVPHEAEQGAGGLCGGSRL
eukprot:23933-Rhodomonas_salina.2